ncbi:uncharacterized protein LOC114872255 isoform X4 [Osmia bicornis bicornis]|uniref:uncharacterized protein LOC114872255 isoform X4 n=1 Tax=Osmia bicornis bicornis TaxID=1437191 RepID=UPI001EAF2DA8|nr:uncharacterized protein LOC114872255 isoform X4 [Osmia bicornis bicornis]
MNFLTLSRLNAFMNIISGNMLPVTSKKTNLPINLKIYWVIVWMIQLSYLTACILGIHYVPTENSLKDSTVAMAVTVEAITLSVYMNSRKNLLRQLIEQLNETLKEGDEMLRTITMETVNPLQKVLKMYTIGSIGSVNIWILLQFVKMTRKEFYYVDYRVPAVFSAEPFSINVFLAGGMLVCMGSTYAIAKKVSLDLYMIHLVRLMTAQYKYLRIRFAMILRHNLKNVEEDVWQSVPWKEEQNVKQEMRMLTCHYESIIKMATILKKVLAPNIGVLYINNVFRFSFLSIMFVMASATEMEKYLIMSYSIGALIQLYMLCFSIQELFEASIAVADDAFYEKWCVYDTSLLRATAIMTFGSKLECKLSSVRSIDLTLPSFMSILNQAYSMCLLFLKAR